MLGRATDCLDLLSAKLGDRTYFLGDRPTSLDAAVFGHLEIIAQSPSSKQQQEEEGETQLQHKLQSCHNLLAFCQRVRKDCFPLLKESE